jgi:hypothetical protein
MPKGMWETTIFLKRLKFCVQRSKRPRSPNPLSYRRNPKSYWTGMLLLMQG